MKRLLTYLTLLLAITTVYGQCDLPSTKGNDFWVGYLFNNGEAGSVTLSLYAVSDVPGSVTVTNPNTGWSTTSTSGIITIPYEAGLNQSPCTVTSFGLHVTSTVDIWLYAFNNRLACGDMATVIPTANLGTSYMVQDYPAPLSSGCTSRSGAEALIVATVDSTTISMTLPCATSPATVASGNTLTVTLMAGQTYLLNTDSPNQFSGMTISSNGKPFALFQGNKIASVPNGNFDSGDHIYEQASPTSSWGQDFVAVATTNRAWGDKIRILSSSDNCRVTINGNTATTLQRGQTYDYHLTANSVKHIHTSEPASAMLLMASSTWQSEPGDVSSVQLTPMEFGVCKSRFRMVSTERCNSYYTAVVTADSSVSGMSLDGNSISSQFTSIGGYSYALVTLSQGLHRLECSNGTFSAHAYAMGNVESYAFPLGRTFLEADYDTVEFYDTICQRQPYNSNGFNLSAMQTVNTGNLTLTEIRSVGGVLTRYILHLTVLPTSYSSVYDTIAFGNSIIWNGHELDAPGNYNDTLTAANGCDSIVTLHLAMRGDTILYRDTICQDEDYSGHGFSATAAELAADSYPHTFTFTRDTTVGTVTRLIMLRLTVLPTSNVSFSRSIVMGDTLHFADTVLTTAGDHIFHYTASNGCDSLVTLHLTYEGIGIKADRTGVCPGEPVVLTATGTHTLIWRSSPPSAELDGLQGQNPITVHPSVPTVYILVDAAGQEVASISVGTAPPPTLCIESNHVELDFDNPVITFHDCSEGRSSTTWTFDDGVTLHGERARRRWRQPLPDSVSVTMTSCNQYNCCADTTVSLAMRIRSVWFPNVFTPNIDGENGTFRCYTSHDVAEFSITVFNRWGLELWSSEDIEQGWDGRRTDGTPCPQDAYVYRFYLRSVNGDVESGIGTVTLLR